MSGTISPNAVDASIPLRAAFPAQQNPLAQAGETARTIGAFNALKMFPGQLELQQQNIAANKQQLLGLQRSTAYGFLAPMLALPPDQWTHQRITDILGRAEAAGANTQPLLADLASAPSGDGQALHDYMRPYIASQMQTAALERLGAVVPHTVLQNTGSAILPVNIAPAGAPAPGAMSQPGGSLRTTLTPGEAASRVQGPTDSEGRTTTAPLGVVTPSDISGLPPIGTGRMRDSVPPALRNPNAPPAPLPGQITTGIGPAEQSERAASGASASAGFQRISDEGNSAVAQRTVLNNMLADLPNFSPGSNAGGRLEIKKFINTYGPTIVSAATLGNVNWAPFKDSIAAQESFDKFANQLANAQGAGSDKRLEVNQGANPYSGQSREGADFVIRQLLGNTDYLAARQRAAAMWPDQTKLRDFNAKWNAEIDPRVFQFARLNPEQKTNYYNGIPEKERRTFQENYQRVKQMGLLP